MLLHGLIGYDPQPAGMQIVFYIVVLLAITAGMRWVAPRGQHGTKQGGSTTAASTDRQTHAEVVSSTKVAPGLIR
ncbi:MAG: hypothetical protein WB542_14670, partial [Polaromonas sp.]